MTLDRNLLYLVELNTVHLDESGQTTSSWIQGLPLGEYNHPVYGKLQITLDRAKRFAENLKNKIRGIDPSINYNHDNANVASGWVKDAEARNDGLWLFVEWTKDAVEKIKNKEYRYFSAEYMDKWKDSTGKEWQDVLLGGALTNRPFMKNLLPINLSETTVGFALELAEAIQRGKEGEKDMDLVKLNKALGLAENTSEEDAFKALAEKLTPPDPNGGSGGNKRPEVPAVNLSTELKKLSEENPMVKALLETVDNQNKALQEFNKTLVEADISRKLAEFDQSKIVLTPVAKDKIHDLLLDMPVNLHEQLWEILGLMKSSSGLLVELGERAGANPRYGRSKDSVSLFMDETNRIAQEKKISFDEAMAEVSRTNPELWDQYRSSSYQFVE